MACLRHKLYNLLRGIRVKKIKKIRITSLFVPIDTSIIEIGQTMEFDCYVKRFKDFVIIIAAGTKIGESELKLLQNTEQHFVSSKEQYKYRELLEKYTIYLEAQDSIENNEIDVSCKKIEKFSLNDSMSTEKKVEIIYDSGIDIMNAFFNDHITSFKKTCIDDVIEAYILLLKKDATAFKFMLNYMSHKDRHDIHSMNVTVISLGLASYLHYPVIQLKELGLASFLHDIGKKKIDKYIFEKKGPLTNDEYNVVRKHSQYSYDIALDMGIKDNILDAILHHHEYLDGSGYPNAKKGQQISSFSQIMTVCDMFDAMTSERSFHNKKSIFDTLNIMKKEFKGKLNVRYIDDLIQLLVRSFRT